MFLSGVGIGALTSMCLLWWVVIKSVKKIKQDEEHPYLTLMKERNAIAQKQLDLQVSHVEQTKKQIAEWNSQMTPPSAATFIHPNEC
jgi:hypothetical protein